MSIALPRWHWALWLLAIAWISPAPGWAQQYIGGNLVTNGTFSSQPTGTSLAAGTDLGNWKSARVYTGSSVDAAEGQVAGQTGAATYRTGNTLSQVPFPGDAANGIPSSSTWLLYNGNLGGGSTNVASNIWYQDLTIVSGGAYVFSFYVSNALNPTLSGKAVPVVTTRLRTTAGANIGSLGTATVGEEATANGGADTWVRVQYTISGATATAIVNAAASTTVRFTLVDGSTGAAVTDGGDVAITGISLRRLNQVPRGQQTAPTVFGRQGAVPLLTLRADDPDPDGSVVSYKIKSLPTASQGVLYLNSSPVRVNQTLTTTEAASLLFDPTTGFSGNALFTYTAIDNSGGESLALNYGIPMNDNACNTQSIFRFSDRTQGEDWSTSKTATVDGIVITSGALVKPTAIAATTMTLAIDDQTGADPSTAQPGKGLVWTADYATDANSGTNGGINRQSSLKFSFTDAITSNPRFLQNFTMVVGDIDAAGTSPGFVDRVLFSGTNAAGNTVTLSASNVATAPTNTFVAPNGVNGTASSGSPAGNIVLAFPEPVKDVTVTYTNLDTNTNPAIQAVTLLYLSWCGEADLSTTLSGPTTATAGQTVYYYATTTNTGPRPTTSAVTTITLPGKPAANTVSVPNGTYDASTGIVTFNTASLAVGASSLNYVSFVMPAGVTSFMGQAKSSAQEIDNTPANNNGTAATANVTTTVGATGASGTALACPPTPGKDGTVASLTATPNMYYAPSASAAAAQKTIALGATYLTGTGAATGGTNIAAGDLLLIVQMQGGTLSTNNDDTYGDGVAGPSANGASAYTAGTYEYAVAASAITAGTAGTLTLRDNLTYSYTQAAATTTQGQQTYQVIRIPQYVALTLGGNLAPPAWNGQLGGVLALDVAGPLNFNGKTLNASGAGFRGGAGRMTTGTSGLLNTDYLTPNPSNAANASKGEGTAGTPQYVATFTASATPAAVVNTGSAYPGGDNGRGAPGNAGGGGNDGTPATNQQNAGGGGGANGGRGGRGGNTWSSNLAIGGEPGAAFPLASSARLALGGGGGAGVTNDGSGTGSGSATAGIASSGAPGGGLVLVRTGSVTGTGSILANGYNADNSVLNDGSGGGGAGGAVLLTAQNPASLGNVSIVANGGTGGTNTGGGTGPYGPGGGGGGGFIFANGPVGGATAVAGTSGTTAGAIPFGAETGTVGVTNTAISNSIAASAADAACVADVAAVLTGPTTVTSLGTVNLAVAFTNNGGLPANTVTRTVTIPSSATNSVTNVTAPGGTIGGNATTGYTITYPNLPSLNANVSSSYSISYTAPAAGSVAASATIGSSNTPPDVYAANNTSSVTTTVAAYADVTTTITGPSTVNPGLATSDFTVNFTNSGPATAAGITQSVTLPTGASITAAQLTALQTKYASSPVTIAYNTTTRVLSFTPTAGNNTLAAGASNTYSFPLTASATPGSVAIMSAVGTSTSQGTGTGALPDAASYSFAVAPLADMVASISNNSAATVTAGSTGTFVATFTNSGPSVAENVVPTVQLPAGLLSVTFPSGLSGTYNASTGLVTYASTATLASGSANALTSTISFTMPSSQVAAVASVNTTTNEGPNTANNTARAAIANASNFDVTTFINGPASAAPGTSVTLSVITQNAGPGTAPSTTQTVTLPGVFTNLYVSNGGTYSNDGTKTTVTFPAIAGLTSGANVNNTITLTMPATALSGVQAAVAAAGETNSLPNTASTSIATATAGTGTVNLYTTISAATADAPTTTLAGPVAPNTTLQFNVTAGNYGPNAAAGAVTRVALPIGLTGVVASGGGVYDATTGFVTFPTSDMAQGATVAYTIKLPAPTNGPLVAVSSITSATAETVIADNVASTKVDILPLADVTTLLSGPMAPTVGQPATYAVTTTNNGPTAAMNVVQTLTLPLGLASVTVTNAAGTAIALPAGAYNPNTGLLTLPAAAVASTQTAGASVLNYVTFTTPASTGYPVTAAVATTSQETNATNNTATVTTIPAPAADVSVALSGPTSALQGNLVTYAVTTANVGPSTNPSSTTTVQLPTGLSNVQVSGGGSYSSGTGLVTFPALTDQAVGAAGAVSNTISFIAPTTTPLTLTAQVAVTPAGNDPNMNNNSATVNTKVGPSTTALLDESTTIAATVGGSAVSASNPVIAGGAVTFNLTATNNSVNAATTAATNVVQRVQLPAGLNLADVVINSGGGSYDPATGVVTFATVGSQSAGATNSYSVTVNNVPGGSTSLTATAIVSTDNSDANPNNNVLPLTLPVLARADITTTIAGPSTITPSSSATYLVTVRNVGPSPASAVNTTVQLPAGLAGVAVSGGGSYDPNSGLVTFPTIATLPAYSGTATASISAQQMAYTITMTAPSTITASAGYTVTSTVTTATAEPSSNQAVNTVSLTTTAANQPPVASNVVNTLQTPEANTGQQLLISPLLATDPDGSVATYALTSLPMAATGKLYYNNGGTYTEILAANLANGTTPLALTPAQAQTLKFTPATGFAGNAFFTYVATDNGALPLTSAPALYTIPVGTDNASVYAKTPVKNTAYSTGDIIAFVTDNNGALYNTSAAIYDANTGVLQSGAANGVASAASTGVFTSSSAAAITTLSQLGLVLDGTTGQLRVQTPANLRPGTYTLNITTTDLYGGVTTQPVTFTIGNNPLPVTLVAFTASAVANRDARLSWTTASEVNNDHFAVERSFDGTSFTLIGTVAGHGTTSAASTYALTDAGVAAKASGPVYYRLRQVDYNGAASYSPVRSLSFTQAAMVSLSLYPNPAPASTQLDLRQLPTTATYQVLLLDATGRTVGQWTLGGGQVQPLDVHELATGAYLLRVSGLQPDGSALQQTLRLTKE